MLVLVIVCGVHAIGHPQRLSITVDAAAKYDAMS